METQARDLKYLHEWGYKVWEIQPMDLFLHTENMENTVLMTNCDRNDE